jgi:hypothetical protein
MIRALKCAGDVDISAPLGWAFVAVPVETRTLRQPTGRPPV